MIDQSMSIILWPLYKSVLSDTAHLHLLLITHLSFRPNPNHTIHPILPLQATPHDRRCGDRGERGQRQKQQLRKWCWHIKAKPPVLNWIHLPSSIYYRDRLDYISINLFVIMQAFTLWGRCRQEESLNNIFAAPFKFCLLRYPIRH